MLTSASLSSKSSLCWRSAAFSPPTFDRGRVRGRDGDRGRDRDRGRGRDREKGRGRDWGRDWGKG